MIGWLNICLINHLKQKLCEKIDFLPKSREKLIKNVGAKGLKFKILTFQCLRGLKNCLFDIHVQFNRSVTETMHVDNFFHKILPNFNKFGR